MKSLVRRAPGVGTARTQRGVSLVELMVALTLGLFIVVGAASIYLANRNSFATVENVARVEENARFAAELLARDIREAGNSMCGGAMTSINLLSSPASLTWAGWDKGLLGNAMGASDTPGVSLLGPSAASGTAQVTSPATDSLLVWSASAGSSPVRISSHTIGTGTINTATPHGFKAGDWVVACDGTQLFTFEVQSLTTTSVTYSGGAAMTKAIDAGGMLSPLTIHLWYVGGGISSNALRRITLNKTGITDNDEMVSGVSDLQIKYLPADVSGTPKLDATYLTAANVNVKDWGTIVAVQIALTLNSADKINPTGGGLSAFTYTLPLTVGIRRRLQP